jgi:hypothetical protein
MANDVKRRIVGKSREEMLRLLGEPDGGRFGLRFPSYYLKPVWPVGDYELKFSLDERDIVTQARVMYVLRE